jgi:very-short-patch-repair endonuclease
VWESRKLIVEIDEDQHRKPVEFFDKPEQLTVSGVHRGEQRRIYDARKRAAARKEGYTVIEIPWPRNPPPSWRDRHTDREALRSETPCASWPSFTAL